MKIAVGETILHGYGFAARRPLANLGLTWLAAAFYAAAVCYWMQNLATTMLVSPHPGSQLNDFAFFDLFCLVVVTAFGNAVIGAALTREALEPSGETKTAYLAVAKREWYLFFGLTVLYALMIGALLAIIFAGGVAISIGLSMLGPHTQWHGMEALPTMNAGVAFVAFAVTALLMTRLGFLMAPIAVAEQSARFTHGWTLSRGNFWRLLVIVVSLLVPAVLIWAAVEWFLIGPEFRDALATGMSAGHDSTALYQLIFENAPVAATAWAVLTVLLNMIFAGASAFAYQSVHEEAPEVSYPVNIAPVADTAFASSFANYTPRHGKEPSNEDIRVEPHHDVLIPVAEEMHAEAVPVVDEVGHSELVTEVEHEPVAEAHAKPAPEVNTDAVPETPEIRQAQAVSSELEAVPAAQTEEHVPEPVLDTPVDVEAAAEPVQAEPTPVDFIAVPQFLLTEEQPLAASAAEEVQAEDLTPPPSHDDATESSQQSAPSEAA